MRIAYLGQMADVSRENGISKKIRIQTQAWNKAGHKVCYFSVAASDRIWEGLGSLETKVLVRGNLARRVVNSVTLAEKIRSWRPDVIYFRYGYHALGLKRLFGEFPTVAELNSDDRKEYPLTFSRAKLIYHLLTRSRILNATYGFVAVTHELCDRFRGFSKKICVIANGISLKDFPELPITEAPGPQRLVFIADHINPWHGPERIVDLAHALPDFEIDVIGSSREDWHALLREPLPATILFHGKLSIDRYIPLLQRATAAIGTMALYKNKMEEACPLKVREYLAMGLPVVGGYKDTDINQNSDYFLRLPNSPGSLIEQKAKILEFLARWKGKRVPRQSIAHIDADAKESDRLTFMETIVNEKSDR
jgi:glycosyltransferase involved in cell wall biosynthesis